jgi:hypothetical protein
MPRAVEAFEAAKMSEQIVRHSHTKSCFEDCDRGCPRPLGTLRPVMVLVMVLILSRLCFHIDRPFLKALPAMKRLQS